MNAYYVPKAITDVLRNCTQQLPLYTADPAFAAHVTIQAYGDDVEFVFYINNERVWGVRFTHYA